MPENGQFQSDDEVSVGKQTNFTEEAPVAMETIAATAEKNPTSTGLEENLAALLCHFPIIGLIFFFMEKENKFVRFHALQVILFSLVLFVAAIAVGIITAILSAIKLGILGLIISGPFYFLLMPASFVLLIYMAYQAYQGKMFKLPLVGKLAEEHSAPKQ